MKDRKRILVPIVFLIISIICILLLYFFYINDYKKTNNNDALLLEKEMFESSDVSAIKSKSNENEDLSDDLIRYYVDGTFLQIDGVYQYDINTNEEIVQSSFKIHAVDNLFNVDTNGYDFTEEELEEQFKKHDEIINDITTKFNAKTEDVYGVYCYEDGTYETKTFNFIPDAKQTQEIFSDGNALSYYYFQVINDNGDYTVSVNKYGNYSFAIVICPVEFFY